MRYIIDVTQLIHWPGNLTGIPRVMDELAFRFLNDTSRETVFVSWVKEVGAMCEIDFHTSRENRGVHITYRTIVSQESPSTPAKTDVKDPARSLTHISKKVVKKLATKSRFDRTSLYQNLIKGKKTIEAASYIKYSPREKDRFFIPWGEWWDQNWLNLLQDFNQKGVQLFPISHDVLPMVVPQFSGNSASLENFVSQIFPISTCVLTVSESSKQDLITWMKQRKLSIPNIQVFRLGEDFTIKKASLNSIELEKRYSIKKEDYLVYVSTIEPRKNHLLLYYTYKLAHARNITLPRLVIVGRVGHDVDTIINMIKNDPEVNSLISIENNVDDNDLNWLYENCKFSITSSFYEGWGMSVLESITRNKPVVCSATSSLLEMPKDCVMHFNPASTDECLAAIQQMAAPSTLKQYIKNTKQYTPHSWDASYKQVVRILDGDKK